MRRALFAACVAAALLAGCGGGGGGTASSPSPPPAAYTPSGYAAAGDVFVHLFEWRWADIARECEVWLGPKGFKAVQISPPNEHALVESPFRPWWQRYQPVSYKLDASRSGTLAEFDDMVARCAAQGVAIYADAVINHMAADTSNATGSAGSPVGRYNYPAVPYGLPDFHTPACSVINYNNASNVQNCELVGLPDLRTENDSVRARIADYLIALHARGVAGFRIDAAKHMPAADLDAILARVNNAATLAGRARPYVFLEVINNAGEAVTAQQYYGVGYASGGVADITEFQFGYRVSDAFLGRNGATLAGLQNLTASLLPSDKVVVFTDNHDNQRAGNVYYVDGAAYELANVFMLTLPHGYPALMSSFGFDRSTQSGRDAGPPGAGGVTASTFTAAGDSTCTSQLGLVQADSWICEHRRAALARMVALRKFAAGAPLSNWRVLGTDNQIAFARTGKAFVALSREVSAIGSASVQTTLPAGTYCDLMSGELNGATCSGTSVTVAADGTAVIGVPAFGAVAIHGGAKAP
jgi:alpha-amylase